MYTPRSMSPLSPAVPCDRPQGPSLEIQVSCQPCAHAGSGGEFVCRASNSKARQGIEWGLDVGIFHLKYTSISQVKSTQCRIFYPQRAKANDAREVSLIALVIALYFLERAERSSKHFYLTQQVVAAADSCWIQARSPARGKGEYY